MGKNNKHDKGNNVNNVDPNSNALATGSDNRGPTAKEDERESSDSSSQTSAGGNPYGPSNRANNNQSSTTRVHNSESIRIANSPAFGGLEASASVETGVGLSVTSAETNNHQLGRSSNTGDLAAAADQHFRVSGPAEAGQASQVLQTQRGLPAVATPSGTKSTDREVSHTGHFTALTSPWALPAAPTAERQA